MMSGERDKIVQIPTAFFREALCLALEAIQARKLAAQGSLLLSDVAAERPARISYEEETP